MQAGRSGDGDFCMFGRYVVGFAQPSSPVLMQLKCQKQAAHLVCHASPWWWDASLPYESGANKEKLFPVLPVRHAFSIENIETTRAHQQRKNSDRNTELAMDAQELSNSSEWGPFREEILHLYAEEGWTLNDVSKKMKDKYGLKKTYVTTFTPLIKHIA